MALKNRIYGLVGITALFGLLAAQSYIPSAKADSFSDSNGDPAGELNVICTDSGSGCSAADDVLMRYSASAGRDLDVVDDADCPACLDGPPFFVSPSGSIYECTGIDYPHSIPSGEMSDISAVNDCGVPLPLEPGTWSYTSDVLGNSDPVIAFFDISFFVIPESAIGAIALVGSSIAALGGFRFWKRKHSNKRPRSLGRLGI